MFEPSARQNEITGQIVDCAYRVHTALGPGLLESVYEQCLALELESRALRARRQVVLPVTYREVTIASAFRIDLDVEDQVLVEVKAVEKLLPIHDSQLLTYLKFSGRNIGLLINFNVRLIKDGIRRFVRTP
jgi:GxxExxY protein